MRFQLTSFAFSHSRMRQALCLRMLWTLLSLPLLIGLSVSGDISTTLCESNIVEFRRSGQHSLLISHLCLCLTGFAFAYGEGSNPFIGHSYFFLMDYENYINFFFQWVFAVRSNKEMHCPMSEARNNSVCSLFAGHYRYHCLGCRC